ncbi:MAG: AsmA family protein [Nevskia sp.]|nr:AsmA family protein [Nevskia sp.]
MRLLLWIVGALVAGVILLIVAVSLLFDANQFRGRISAQVQTSVHRRLDIGDIHLGVFPTLGARIKDLKLGNAEGFGDEPMAVVGEAEVGVRLLPLLLHRQVEVGSVTLKDLQLNLLRRADGASNWDDLTHKQPAQPQAPAAPQAGQAGAGTGLAGIGGVDIDNASISYVDQQAHKSYALSKLRLKTGAIGSGAPFDFKLGFSAASADPQVNADVTATARLAYDRANRSFDAQNLEAVLDASGPSVPGGKQELKLSGSAHLDSDKGTFKLADGKLRLANITLDTSVDGTGLDGAAPHFSGPVSVAPFNPRDTFKAIGLEPPRSADGEALKQASLTARLDAGKDGARLEQLVVKLDQSTLAGSASIADFSRPALQFALQLDQLDADRYLPQPGSRNPVAAPAAGQAAADNAPLAIGKLDTFDAAGTLDIGKLKLKNLNLSRLQLKLAAARGAQKTAELTAGLYGGSFSSTTRMGPGARPAYAESARLVSVNAGPLLQDLTGKDHVTGQGNFSADLTGTGGTVGEIKRTLNGNVATSLQNGVVKGFNLAQVLRRAQAVYKGQQPEQGGPQETAFSSITATGKFVNGVLHSDDLKAVSSQFNLTGAGQVDLVESTLDYTATPVVTNLAGLGGLEQLQGIAIPIHLSGPLSAPRYQLDVASVLRQEAVQKLTQKLGGQKGSDLLNKLNDLFGKKKQ